MAGIGLEDGSAEKALGFCEKIFGYTLWTSSINPAFTKYLLNLGEISTYPQAIKKMQVFSVITIHGLLRQKQFSGRGDRAFEYYS